MDKVLVTNGSHAELPMIEALHEMGYYVITTGNNRDGVGHKNADEYIPGDFSNKEFVYNLAKEKEVCGIVSGCNDFAYISSAYACEKLGLKGNNSYENAVLIHHKDMFREKLLELGIKTPNKITCYSKEEAIEAVNKIGFPCMVKAIDLTGGKGIRKCNSVDEAIEAIEQSYKSTRENRIIVEEFIEGTNHGYSCLIKNHKVVFGFLDEEQYYLNPYLVSGACGPSASTYVLPQLKSDIELLSRSVNLASGLFHVQIIIDKNDNPIMIDPCLRAPGDLYVNLVKYSTGVNYPKEIVKAALGLELEDEYNVESNYISRECCMSNRIGTYKGLEIDDSVKDKVFDQLIWAKPGDVFEDYLKDKAGILFMKYNSYEEMMECINHYYELVKIEFEG